MTLRCPTSSPPEAGFADLLDLLRPRSVAVVGASADPGKFGARIIPSMLRQGFTGRIFPINARHDEVQGLKAYRDVASIAEPVDCVVFCIASRHIGQVLADCEAKAVKLLVITSAGFGEGEDAEGKKLQQQVAEFAHRTGTRVVGPNCIGFANFVDRVCVSAAAALEWPDIPKGRIGLASQSGGLGLASIIYQALSEDIGFSHIISTGNEADLGAVEIARALVHDPHTDVVTLTLEAVRDGDAFATMLEEAAAAAKPVVILKSGRSELGQKMAASHTGALAGSAAVFEALCRRTGVVLVNDLDELFQFAQMFVKLRQAGKLAAIAGTAPGEGIVGFSVSGGHVGLLADLGALAGLAFPELSEPTRQRLAKELGGAPDLLNPLDLTGGMVTDHSIWGRCLRIVLDDPAVAVAVPVITVAHNYDPASQDIIDVAGQHDKPVMVVWAGGSFAGQGKPLLRNSPVPTFDTPARAISAIAALDTYVRGQSRAARRPARESLARNGFQSARHIIEDARRRGRKSLDENASKSVLRELGLPVTREQLVHSRAEAVSAAESIGFPVALKGQHPDILHKSEAGIIRLGLAEAEAVAAAFDEVHTGMAAVAGPHDDSGVLVQEMIEGATELIMGTSLDPTFGPVVMFGLGGVYVEILEDIALAVPPFDLHEAIELMHRTRAIKLLKGARGRKAADIEQLAGLLVSLGDFAHANRDLVREIDINPLVFIDRDTDQFRAVDGLVILATE